MMRAGNKDKRDHEIAKMLSMCKQYAIWLPNIHVASFYVGNALKIDKKQDDC